MEITQLKLKVALVGDLFGILHALFEEIPFDKGIFKGLFYFLL